MAAHRRVTHQGASQMLMYSTLVVADLGELRIDHIVWRGLAAGLTARYGLRFLLGLIDRLAKLHRHVSQRLRLFCDLGWIAALDSRFAVGNGGFDLPLDRQSTGLN